MPTERFAMRHVRDVMRLKAAGMPSREIARRVGAAPSMLRAPVQEHIAGEPGGYRYSRYVAAKTALATGPSIGERRRPMRR
jgi:hypothetical protein